MENLRSINVLAGLNQVVGNWPGVTVDKKIGSFVYKGKEIEIVDLPGIYSLSSSNSFDEKITQNFLANQPYDLVINVIDSANLARNLYLTTQLLEMRIPLLVVLNMSDIAEKKGIDISLDNFESCFKVKVVKLIARNKIGIEELKEEIISFKNHEKDYDIISQIYPQAITKAIIKLSEETNIERGAALQLLEINESKQQNSELARITSNLEELYDDEIAMVIASQRYDFINSTVKEVISQNNTKKSNISNCLDKILLNQYTGIPIFLLIMYLMFTFSIVIGGAFQNFGSVQISVEILK